MIIFDESFLSRAFRFFHITHSLQPFKENSMSFTGKATYSAGSTLPEIAEDVSDLVAINSPYETPLLDALGDPARVARSTVHQWLEDSLLPNTDNVESGDPAGTSLGVDNFGRFRVGDQIRIVGQQEIMLVTAVNTGSATLTVVRGYGGTPTGTWADGNKIQIIGNAALEGDDAADPQFTDRIRMTNYTQIFSDTVEVSGSELAVTQIGISDELDYQKNLRVRELLRDLENSVINGVAPGATPEGSATVRRTMNGIINSIATNFFAPGEGIPSGTTLTEAQLNLALRAIWQNSAGNVDLILVGGQQKRSINSFIATNQRFVESNDDFKSLVNVYESDFGVCRIVMSRFVPSDTVLLLDSSRIEVLPLAGRSFQHKPLASTGDREAGLVVGEYTLEFRNESAHGIITGLTGA
jgi:Family of unknown function (DUF5309)